MMSGAIVESAEERLFRADPELKATGRGRDIACKGHLRWPIGQHVQDFAIFTEEQSSQLSSRFAETLLPPLATHL